MTALVTLIRQFWGLHAAPGRLARLLLGLAPFLLLASIYAAASHQRQLENEHDKVLPSFSQMVDGAYSAAFVKDRRKDQYLLWVDTVASLQRLALGVALAALAGLALGLLTGVFPGGRALISPYLSAIAMVPPLAILPILFISLGVDEVAKVALVFFGLFALMARDMDLAVTSLPGEQRTKALTLGAGGFDLIVRIILPQVLPRLIDSVRLSLGAAWLFVIAAEAIAAEAGLGYRIFLVRRYFDMATIIPYVLWITLLGFLMDLSLRTLTRLAFPWHSNAKTA